MSHTPQEDQSFGDAPKGYSAPEQEVVAAPVTPEAKEPDAAPAAPRVAPQPIPDNHVVNAHGYGHSDHTNYTVPQSENFYGQSMTSDGSWAWTSYVALAASVVNFLVSLIPFFNFLVAPFTGVLALVFVILAFIGVSERKNDKKTVAIVAACLLIGSVFAFIFSYLFLAVLSSV